MINWYITLYLGVILLLYLFPYIGSFPSPKDYTEGLLGYGGLSTGTNLLLSRLVSGDLIALAILSVLSYGILGGLCFALVILISISFFILALSKLQKTKTAQNILELLKRQTKGLGYAYHILILLACSLGNMILQLAALKYLLGIYYFKSGFLIIFFVSAFSLAYAGLGGFDALSKGAKPQMLIVFLSTAAITISIFLENGLAATYLDFTNVPYQHLSLTEAVPLFFTGIVIITALYLLDNSLWHSVYRLKPQRQYAILFLTVFCVLGISLGYSAVSVYGLTQGLKADDTLILMLETNGALILANLFIITVFAAAISSYAFNLFSTVQIFLNYGKINPILRFKGYTIEMQTKHGYLFALIFLLLVWGVFSRIANIPLLKLVVILGILYSSLAIPFLQTLFRSSQVKSIADYIGVLTLIIGIGFFLRYNSNYTPLLCFGIGLFLQMVISLLTKILKILQKQDNILQK